MIKQLDENQIRQLFNDILKDDVKRFDNFSFGRYYIKVGKLKSDIFNKEERLTKQRKYNCDRIKNNIKKEKCTRCGKRKPLKNKMLCKQCRDYYRKHNHSIIP